MKKERLVKTLSTAGATILGLGIFVTLGWSMIILSGAGQLLTALVFLIAGIGATMLSSLPFFWMSEMLDLQQKNVKLQEDILNNLRHTARKSSGKSSLSDMESELPEM